LRHAVGAAEVAAVGHRDPEVPERPAERVGERHDRSILAALNIRVAILTVSDGVAAGARPDLGGPACEVALRASGIEHRVVSRETIPDEPQQVARAVRVCADAGDADLIVLTGGTGVAPRDRTPEGVR